MSSAFGCGSALSQAEAEIVGQQSEQLRRRVIDGRKHHSHAIGPRDNALEGLANLNNMI